MLLSKKTIEVSAGDLKAYYAEQRAFVADRIGHNDSGPLARCNPQRLTYLAHGKGYVMVRHPGCIPFAISEKLWRSFPLLEK